MTIFHSLLGYLETGQYIKFSDDFIITYSSIGFAKGNRIYRNEEEYVDENTLFNSLSIENYDLTFRIFLIVEILLFVIFLIRSIVFGEKAKTFFLRIR